MCTHTPRAPNTAKMDNAESSFAVYSDADCSDADCSDADCAYVELTDVERKYTQSIDIVRHACCVHMDSIPTLRDCMRECAPRGEAQSLEGSTYVAFFGFGSVQTHTALIHVIQTTLCPLLVHSSFVKPSNFEGIMALRACQSSEAVERLFDCFTMSIGVVQIDTYMCESMLTCLERIACGVHTLGNLQLLVTEQTQFHATEQTQLHATEQTHPQLQTTVQDINHVLMFVAPRAVFTATPTPRPVLDAYEVQNGTVFLHIGSIMYTPTHMQPRTPPPPQILVHAGMR